MIVPRRPLALRARAVGDGPHAIVARVVAAAQPYRLWSMQPRGRLGPYYLDWGTAAGDRAVACDDAGVRVEPLDGWYDPVRIAEYALDAHARYLASRSERAADVFFAQAEWLRDRACDGCYPMPMRRPRYGARAGYLSARAQSLAISVLLRAEELRPRARFLAAAIRAAAPMVRDVGAGGVMLRRSDGDTFLEDVAVEPAAHRLDGCVIGCFGLFELQRSSVVPWIGPVVGATIGTLQRRLALYDRGSWSYEAALMAPDGSRRIAARRAHALHVALLHVFASMIDDPQFACVAQAWARRTSARTTRRIAVSERGLRAVERRLAVADRIDRGARPLF